MGTVSGDVERGRMGRPHAEFGGGGLACDDCRGFPLVMKYSTKCSSFGGKLKNCVNALVASSAP